MVEKEQRTKDKDAARVPHVFPEGPVQGVPRRAVPVLRNEQSRGHENIWRSRASTELCEYTRTKSKDKKEKSEQKGKWYYRDHDKAECRNSGMKTVLIEGGLQKNGERVSSHLKQSVKNYTCESSLQNWNTSKHPINQSTNHMFPVII